MIKFVLLSLVLCGGCAYSQQSIVRGVVSIHNSETETGTCKYVIGALVEDTILRLAQPSRTDEYGRFELVYIGVPPGTSVTLSIRGTDGLKVVRLATLSAVTDQLEPVRISMATPKWIERHYAKVDSIGDRVFNAKYKSIIDRNNKEIARLKASGKLDQQRKEQLEFEVTRIKLEKRELQNTIHRLSERFIEINLDESSESFRKAYRLFEQGKIDSAIAALDALDFEREVQTYLTREKKLKSDRITLIDNLSFSADLFFLNHDFQKAITVYENLIQIDSTESDYWLQKGLMQSLSGYEYDAIFSYNKALQVETLSTKSGNDSNKTKVRFARIYFNLGTSLDNIDDTANALSVKKMAVNEYKKIYHFDVKYRDDYAAAVNNYAIAVMASGDTSLADKLFKEAIDTFLSVGGPQCEYNLAVTGNNIANIAALRGDFRTAESIYLSSINIFLKLEKSDTNHRSLLASTYKDIGFLYLNNDSLEKAANMLGQSQKYYSRLYNKNQIFYAADVAHLNLGLGLVYDRKGNNMHAKSHYANAFMFYKILACENPNRFYGLLYRVLNNLNLVLIELKESDPIRILNNEILALCYQGRDGKGIIYCATRILALKYLGHLDYSAGNYGKSLQFYSKAAIEAKECRVDTISAYADELGNIQSHIGNAHFYLREFDKAEESYSSAARYYTIAHSVREYISVQTSLGRLYFVSEKFYEAEKVFYEVYRLSDSLNILFPGEYRKELVSASIELGDTYHQLKNVVKLKQYYSEAIKHLEKNPFSDGDQECLLSAARAKKFLGIAFLMDGKYEEGKKLLVQSRELYLILSKTDPRLRSSLAQIETNLGSMYVRIKDFVMAKSCFEKSLKYYIQLNDAENIKNIQGRISGLAEMKDK